MKIILSAFKGLHIHTVRVFVRKPLPSPTTYFPAPA